MSIDKLVSIAKKQGLLALGLTDTANMFGAMEFSLALQKEGIKPILGTLLPVFMDDGDEKTSVNQSSPFLLPLYVQNEVGYRNLSQLVTLTTVGQEDQWAGGVHVSQMVGKTQGLIAFSGGARGKVPLVFTKGAHYVQAHLEALANLFPKRFYVEIERTHQPAPYEDVLIELALKHNWPLVATNEAFFAHEDDHAAGMDCTDQGVS